MRLTILAASVAAALMTATAAVPVPAEAAAAASVSTADYVTAARAANQFTVYASQTASRRGQTPDVRDYGQVTQTQHERMLDQIGFILSDLKMPAPKPQLSAKQNMLLDELDKTADAQLDRKYLELQIASHEEILAAHRAYAASGEQKELKDYAADMVTRHQNEIDRAKRILAALK
jgi:putative membrane protein